MKHILIIAALLVFAYVAFVPPDGVRKFPVATVQVDVQFGEGEQGPPGK